MNKTYNAFAIGVVRYVAHEGIIHAPVGNSGESVGCASGEYMSPSGSLSSWSSNIVEESSDAVMTF